MSGCGKQTELLGAILFMSLLAADAGAQNSDRPPMGVPDKDYLVLDLQGTGIDLTGSVTTQAPPAFGRAQPALNWHWPKAGSGNGFLIVDLHGLEQAQFDVQLGAGVAGRVPAGYQRLGGALVIEWKKARKNKAVPEQLHPRPGVWNVLAALDTDHDGAVDAADPAWPCLGVWIDKDGEGEMQANEQVGLAQAGVKCITVPQKDPYATVKPDADGDWRLDGEFTTADGKKRPAAAVTFFPSQSGADAPKNNAAGSEPGAGDILLLDLGKGIDLSGTVLTTQKDAPVDGGILNRKWNWPKPDSGTGILVIDWRALPKGQFNIAEFPDSAYRGPARTTPPPLPTIMHGSQLFVLLKNGQLNPRERGHGVWNNLRILDLDHDGVLDASDATWPGLKVWIDADGDGAIQANEVEDLAQAGVKQITVPKADPYKDLKRDASGLLRLDGEYVATDGSKRVAASVVLTPLR